MKNILLFLCLLTSAMAQQVAEITTVKIPYMNSAELSTTVLPASVLVQSETYPWKLFIGDGATVGGIEISPPSEPWNYIATANIRMSGYRLELGSGFSIYQLGGYGALSGDGALVATPGISTWGDSVNPFIRITGGSTLGSISSFTWSVANEEFTALVVDVGAGAPSIEWTDDLVDGSWAAHTATVTGPADGVYTAVFEIPAGETLAFFRATYPTGSTGKIELLNSTEITGPLSVSGAITGSLNSTNLVGSIPANLLPAVVSEAEAEAGTLTDARMWTPARVRDAIETLAPKPPMDFVLGYYPSAGADQLDWLLVGRAVLVASASPGVAYAQTAFTAEAVFTLQKNGTSIGTVTFAAAGTTGTFSVASDVSFASGDRIEVVAPETPDATGEDIQILIRSTVQ